jgi:hypothetical protein
MTPDLELRSFRIVTGALLNELDERCFEHDLRD